MITMTEEVVNLDEILLPKHLGENRKIVGCVTKRLTEAGENYGSLMLALDVKLKNTVDGTEDILHVVAKAVPNNEFIRKMFQSHVTFKKELELYKTIVPTLKEFAREGGIENVVDFFPEFYGGRLGKEPNSSIFDDNAVILLENLKIRGFVCEDRTKGFDFETAKSIITRMSIMHALPIALKLKKPDVFQQKVLPFLNHVQAFDDFGDDAMNKLLDETQSIAEECPGCVPYLKNLSNAIKSGLNYYKSTNPPREPFATLSHCDFWVNNVMINKDNSSTSIKIVDFQFIEYGSPVRDIIMFIFDSVQNNVVVEHYDHLIEVYHRNFIDILDKFGIDTGPFSLEKLKEEINMGAKEVVVSQCFIMVKPICAEKDAVKHMDDISEQDFIDDYTVPQRHKEKIWMIVEEFGRRGWI